MRLYRLIVDPRARRDLFAACGAMGLSPLRPPGDRYVYWWTRRGWDRFGSVIRDHLRNTGHSVTLVQRETPRRDIAKTDGIQALARRSVLGNSAPYLFDKPAFAIPLLTGQERTWVIDELPIQKRDWERREQRMARRGSRPLPLPRFPYIERNKLIVPHGPMHLDVVNDLVNRLRVSERRARRLKAHRAARDAANVAARIEVAAFPERG